MKDLITLEKEFNSLGEEIISKIEIIKALPSNDMKQRKFAWTGIVGIVQNVIDTNRAQKILGTVICDGKTYLDMFNYLLEATDRFVAIQKQIQEQLTPSDKSYYGNIDIFIDLIEGLHTVLCCYSSTVSMTYDDDNESISQQTISIITNKLRQLDCKAYEVQGDKNNSNSNSGCFGAMLLLIVSTLTVLGCVSYGIVQIIA